MPPEVNDVEHVFDSCLFSLVKRPFMSLAHFLIGFFSPIVEFGKFLYILDNNPLSDMWFADIFCQSIACIFILLIGSCPHRAKDFKFDEVKFMFLFVDCAFVAKSRKSLSTLDAEDFLHCFF